MNTSSNSISREFNLVVTIAIGALGLTAFWDGVTLGYRVLEALAQVVAP
jgi:hypothetical protein